MTPAIPHDRCLSKKAAQPPGFRYGIEPPRRLKDAQLCCILYFPGKSMSNLNNRTHRLYLTGSERAAFRQAARGMSVALQQRVRQR